MNAADIRAQLDQLAATGTAIKSQTPQSYHAVIADRLKALKP